MARLNIIGGIRRDVAALRYLQAADTLTPELFRKLLAGIEAGVDVVECYLDGAVIADAAPSARRAPHAGPRLVWSAPDSSDGGEAA
jgi:hypothetical protein